MSNQDFPRNGRRQRPGADRDAPDADRRERRRRPGRRPFEHREIELHSYSAGYVDRIRRAVSWIHEAFDRFDAPCLNYSGGKDSLVLLHLTAQRCGYDDFPVYHLDHTPVITPVSVDFVRASVQRIGGDLYVQTWDDVIQEILTGMGEEQAAFESLFEEPAEEHGWDAGLVGIRAEESDKRADRFESDGSTVPIDWETAQPTIAPIHHLRTRDIWAYIVEHDLEYHDIYDEQDNLLGLEWTSNPGVWYSD